MAKTIEELIQAGKRGVTKHQMIPAIKENVDDAEALKTLYSNYNETFLGSLRYVNKAVRDKVHEVIEIVEDDDIKKELEARLKPKRKGVTYHQIIMALEDAVDRDDMEEIKLIRKYYPEKYNNSMKYVSKKYRNVIENI
jgi:hypothetical protein